MRKYFGISYDVEDLFSEAQWRMIDYWHKREAAGRAPDATTFPNEQDFLGWFFVLSLNIVRGKLRPFKELWAEGLTLIYVPIDDLPIADPRVKFERECLRTRFLEFTETLSTNHHRAAELWTEGYTARESRDLLNGMGIKCSHVTVQKWINAALRAFRDSLRDDGDAGTGV
ncbi:MAG TPA: hypothetical protein VF546_24165 [Pyrinomonadaceae bacterium]|jgi:hypothetical protein